MILAARAEFLNRQMVENAGLAGLDAVDALLALGRLAEAQELATRLNEEFRYVDGSEHVLKALAYLQEFLPRKHGREVVTHVRSFLGDAARRNRKAFVPPPEEPKF